MATTDKPRGRDFGVEGRVVIITGAGQGIGREYARQFAAAGAIPVVADLNPETAEQAVLEIITDGGRALAVATDVSDPASIANLVDRTMAAFGRIDILINNASNYSGLVPTPFDQIPLDTWNRVMNVNLTGSFLAAQAVVPHMRAAGWGRIINTSSASVPLGMKDHLHYVSAKAGIVGMTSAMARELGDQGITVNAILPGGVFTEGLRAIGTNESKMALIAAQCIPCEGEPMDLAGLAIFLSSPAAAFLTGQTIACDGGLTNW
ncbi:3-oxoacyl-ACP reductase FabG [soil metagenome]